MGRQVNSSMDPQFQFTAQLWIWQGKGAWHFIRVPHDISAQIKGFQGPKRGFGSVRVEACIGQSKWSTSIFPEKEGTYLLPIKKEIRQREALQDGDDVKVELLIKDIDL